MVKQNWKAARSRIKVKRRRTARWSGTAQDRWQLAARLAFPASLLVIFLILFVAIVGWLNPVPSPKLILLTTRNAGETLPPNAAGAADARMLGGLRSVFDVSDANSGSDESEQTNHEQMLAIIDGMRNHTPRQQLLAPWKPTTTVFYVNAIGVGLPDNAGTGESTDTAWLVPDGFDPTEDPRTQLVQLADLIDSVAASAADQKLLVLDCQRPNVHSYFGAAAGRFVDAAVSELEALPPGKQRGLYVLLSSSPGEVSWPMHPQAGSAFGHFFADGISGKADQDGDQDERVTLDELADYVGKQVRQWVASYCLATQQPRLIGFGQDSAAVLITAGRSESPAPAALPGEGGASRSQVASALERNWTRCFDMSRRTQPPFEWAPVQWSYIQDRLLLAERLYRSGDYANAGLVLKDLDAAFESLIETHRSLQQLIAVSSPSAAQFLLSCCGADWPELPGVGAVSADQELVGDVVAGTTPLDKAVSDLADSAKKTDEPLSPAAQFLRLVAARRGADTALTEPQNERAVLELLKLRTFVEKLARPEQPLVVGWIRRDLEAADLARRMAEDRALLENGQPLPLGQPSPRDIGDPESLYRTVQDRQELLEGAFHLRDRLLAELPFWISFIESSQPHIIGWNDTENAKSTADAPAVNDDHPEGDAPPAKSRPGEDFPRRATALVNSLLDDLTALTAELLVDPSELDNDELDRCFSAIVGFCDRIDSTNAGEFAQLRRELPAYADALSQERVWPATGDTWRRIDSVLHLPLPMLEDDSDDAASPRDAARLRLLLVARTAEQLSPSDGSLASAQAASELEQRNFITRLFQRFYSLPAATDSRQPVAKLAAEDVRAQLIDLALGPEISRIDLVSQLRADLAFRLLRRSFGTDLGVTSPVIKLRTGALVDSLLWQSDRVMNDFYAAFDEDDKPYFDRLASELLDGAEALFHGAESVSLTDHPVTPGNAAGSPEAEEVAASAPVLDEESAFDASRSQQRLNRLRELLQSSHLTVQPGNLQFRATFSEDLAVSIARSGDYPAGIAAVSADSAPAVGPTADGGGAVRFQIDRPSESAGANSSMNAIAYFRGHRFTQRVPVTVISGRDGPSVTYYRQNTGNGYVRLRARRLEHEPLHLLFVLDCSGSMALPDKSGEPRIAALRHVLTEFAENVAPGAVDVGVRLFGHRYLDVTAPEAHTDTQLILPIGTFGRARLQDVLDQLRPVGHSPIFNALIQAKDDFESDGSGRRDIVLISDGADNWALAGLTPGVDQLQQAFLGTGIRINAIGYQVDKFADYRQLQQIAASGDVNGKCVSVDNARALLREIAGLAGLPGYRILKDGNVMHEDFQFTAGAQAVELPPGDYDVEVMGSGKDVLASKSIRLRPGESHDLVYDSASLSYEDSPRDSAVAISSGAGNQPDLVVLEAQRIDAGLTLEFGLLDKPDNPVDLLPISATITAVTPGGRREWHLKHLPPNVANRHFPLWRVELSDWPADVSGTRIAVTWNDRPSPSDGFSPVVPLDWGNRFTPRSVADGLLLTRREEQSVMIDGTRHDAMALTFVLENRGPGIERWGVLVEEPILYALHSYDLEYGIGNVQLVLQDDSRPDHVLLFESSAAPTDRELEVGIPLGNETINR